MENDKGKFCGSCGANMPETAQFCPKCGSKAPVMPGQPVAQNDAAATVGTPSVSPIMPPSSAASATPVAGTGSTSGYTPNSFSAQGASSFGGTGSSAQMRTMPQTDLGMNWYKFIIYFDLFAQALVLVILVICLFTGGHYGGFADYVYTFFDGLQALDMIFGFVCLALVAMAIYVRQKLAHFTRDAPNLFYAFIIASHVAALVYFWAFVSIFSSATYSLFGTVSSVLSSYDTTSAISTYGVTENITIIGSCAIWLGVNIAYFKKRAHLFVN